MFAYSSYVKMIFTFSLSDRMTCFISTILVMLYSVFPLIKSYDKLLIFQTIIRARLRSIGHKSELSLAGWCVQHNFGQSRPLAISWFLRTKLSVLYSIIL